MPNRCATCGETLLPEEASGPCPACGGQDRDIVASDTATGTEAIQDRIASIPHEEPGWLDQWHRVLRRRDILEDLAAGGPLSLALTPAEREDAVLAFFEACHHLKDWLGNDPTVAVTRSDCDELINRSPVLQAVADLANGAKHLRLTGPRSKTPVSFKSHREQITIDRGKRSTSLRYIVAMGDDECNADDLAWGACEIWLEFLKDRGLSLPDI